MASSQEAKPFVGYVETTIHALRLIYAARQGVIPRITRRLNDAERKTMIKSGAVFVFGVEESGIKRWTDGLLWSPSRIVGNFLVYREINERASGRGSHRRSYTTDDSAGPRGSPHNGYRDQRSLRYAATSYGTTDPGTFKPNGLIKKTITVTVDGSDLHLISYYTSEDIRSGRLKKPNSRLDIMSLDLPPGIFRLTNFRNPPKVETGPDGRPRLVTDTQESESVSLRETPYRANTTPNWTNDRDMIQGSQRPFPNVSVSPVPISQPEHNRFYPESSGEETWTSPFDTVRSVPSIGESRQDVLWSMPPLSHIDEGSAEGRNAPMLDDSLSNDTWSPWQSSERNRPSYDVHTINSEPFIEKTRSRNMFPTANLVPITRRKDHVVGFGGISASPEHGTATLGHIFPTDNTNRHTAHLRPEHCFNQRPALLTKYPNHAFGDLSQPPYPTLWSSGSESGGSESHTPEEVFAQPPDFGYPEPDISFAPGDRFGGRDTLF